MLVITQYDKNRIFSIYKKIKEILKHVKKIFVENHLGGFHPNYLIGRRTD